MVDWPARMVYWPSRGRWSHGIVMVLKVNKADRQDAIGQAGLAKQAR